MNTPFRILVILLALSICIFIFGSQATFGQYHFDSWTTDNGLPQNGVRVITQTPDGYLWFTTFDGLVRFDGIKFTTFNKGNTKGIINNRFTGIYCDEDGTLYAQTVDEGGLTVYRNGVFKSYDSEQVPESYIKRIEKDENGELVFLAGTDGVDKNFWYYLRDEKFVLKGEFKNQHPDVKVFEGRSGKFWAISKNKITETFNGNSTVYSYQFKHFNNEIPSFEDRSGGLWIGGSNLIHVKDGKINTFEGKYGFPVGESDYHTFWEESDGSIWFANGGFIAPGTGLVHYHNGKFSIFGKEQGLTSTNIHSIYRDRENNIWLGTGKGINRLKKSVIDALSVKDGLIDSEVYPIYRDSKNDIWVGTAKGISVYRNGKFEPVHFNSGIDGKQFTFQSLLEDSNGKMWFGVTGNIYLYKNGDIEHLKSAELMTPNSILQDRTGDVWVTTEKGILRYKDYKLEKHYTVKDGLLKNFVSVAYEDSRGDLWFGGLGGLSKFKDGKFVNYTSVEGLAGNYVRTMYEDRDGVLWIGTYDEGLSRFKDGKFFSYKKENGLYSNGVFAIEEDSYGYFWISSNQGIYRVKKQNLNDFADGKAEEIVSTGYDKSDGMLNLECNGGRQPASLRDEDGHLWFPTQDGIAIVNPEAQTYNTLPPKVVIESATIERKEIDISDGLIIEQGEKNIEINFTGISLIKSGQIKFKYKLEGHDIGWIDAGTRRTAYYSYLPPGNYTFHVKAANSDGLWNNDGAQINLELKPFLYQTNFFLLICIGIGAVLLLAIWKFSVYQLESREQYLAKLVNERTEELKSANKELHQLANSDGLTKIGNRRRFEEFLNNEWSRAIRFKNEVSLILLDIDHFKLFNDSYGHLAGDDCLQKVAQAIEKTIHRPTDLAARYGGEEFSIVLGGTTNEGAVQIAEQIIKNIRSLKIEHDCSTTSEFLTVSVGVATTFVEFGMKESQLIKAADDALYKAKENGRNQIISDEIFIASAEFVIPDAEFAKIL